MTKDPVITIDCQLSGIQVSPKSYIQGCYAASSMHKTTITTKTNKQTNKKTKQQQQQKTARNMLLHAFGSAIAMLPG